MNIAVRAAAQHAERAKYYHELLAEWSVDGFEDRGASNCARRRMQFEIQVVTLLAIAYGPKRLRREAAEIRAIVDGWAT
jgi:hypothetical protein